MDIYKSSSVFDVSIVIATYNAGKHIEDCLLSIINQTTDRSIQLIIIDGKSTDNTLAILKKYDAYIDVLLSEKDKGIYDALNKAIPYLKGRWVYFMGSDDRLLADFSKMLEALKDENTVYYGDCETKERILGGEYSNYKLAKDIICHQSILYPQKVFFKYQYQTHYKVLADYVLSMQCWGDKAFKKEYLPILMTYYNLTGFSSYTVDHKLNQDRKRLIKQYLGNWIFLRYQFRLLKRDLRAMLGIKTE